MVFKLFCPTLIDDELIKAVKYNKIDLVQHLLLQRASVNLADNQGQTALCLASRKGHLTVVETPST